MNAPAQVSALQALQWPLAAIVMGVLAAGIFVYGSIYYLKQEKGHELASKRALQEAQARVANASKEAADLRASADTYQQLVAHGVFQPEKRLDWIESVDQLKAKHKIVSLEYNLSPQRTVALRGGRVFASIEVLGSRLTLKVQAYHDGDLVNFLDDLAKSPNGFYPTDRCTIRSLDSAQTNVFAPKVEADCAMDWITIRDKHPAIVATDGGKH